MKKTLIIILLIVVFILNLFGILESISAFDENIIFFIIACCSATINFILLIIILKVPVSSSAKQENIEKHVEHEIDTTKQIEKNEISTNSQTETIDAVFENLSETEEIEKTFEKLLSNISKSFEIVQGLAFTVAPDSENTFKAVASYAHYKQTEIPEFKLGEGITGQVAKNKELIRLDNVPENYITVVSGLGSGSPQHLLIFPVISNEQTVAVIELASFKDFGENSEIAFNKIAKQLIPFVSP